MAHANTPKAAVGTDLRLPSSYAPAGLPGDADDVILSANHALPYDASLVVGSLNSSSGTVLNKGTVGVSTITLGGPGSTGNVTPGTDPADLIYAGGNTFTLGATSGGGDLIDLSLGRSGRITAASGAQLNITSAVATNGHDLTFAGGGRTRVWVPGGPTFGSGGTSFNTGLAGYGGISGSGNVAVATTGNGYFLLDGINTYTGVTTINPGATLGLAGSIDRSAAIVNNGLFNIGRRGHSTIRQPISGTGELEIYTFLDADSVTTNPTSTYTGRTSVRLGVLVASKLADGGQASSIGASTSDAGNLVLGEYAFSPSPAALRYVGPTASTDRLLTSAMPYQSGSPLFGSYGLALVESSGTGPLTFTSTGAVAYNVPNASRAVGLGGTNKAVNTFSPIIGDNGTGSVGFIKTGTGTWRLTGGDANSAGNTYSGTTTIHEGLLIAAKPTSLGKTTGSIQVMPGGAVGVDFPITQAFVNRVNGYSLNNVSGGTIALMNDTVTNLSFNGFYVTLGAGVGREVTYSGVATFPGNAYRLGGGGGSLTFASPITAAGATVTVGNALTPAESVVVLSGNNTYTGATRASGGILRLAHSGAAGPGSLYAGTNGTIVPAGPISQAFVGRFASTNSVGAIGLVGDNNASVDMATAGSLSLGAYGDASFSGVLTPSGFGYLLGGGGGTLRFNADLTRTDSGLTVTGNGLPSSTVVLNGANATNATTVNNATLALGPNGALPDNKPLTLLGVARLDLGGRAMRVSAVTAPMTPDYQSPVATVRNGSLTLTGTQTIRPSVYDPGVIDFSELTSFTVGSPSVAETAFTLGFNIAHPRNGGVNSRGASAVRLAPSTQVRAVALTLGGTADNDITLGQSTTLNVSTVTLGAANATNTLRFGPASSPTLRLRGLSDATPVATLSLPNGEYGTTILDLSAGTTDALIQTVNVGYQGTGIDSAATLILGGSNSVLNVGEMFVNRVTNTATNYGIAVDTVEQRAGTVLAGALTLTGATISPAEPKGTVLAEYALGTPDSSAVLSVGGVSIGSTAVNAKSRSTLRFNNGRIEPLDPTRAAGGVLPTGPLGVPAVVTIAGTTGGGTAVDSRALNIVLDAAGTHTFAAQAERTLVVDSTALITGPGGLSIQGSGTVAFRGANTYAGVTTVSGGTLRLSPAAQYPVVHGAGADIRDGRVVFDYTGGTSPAALVRTLLAASYGNGFADGQIFSSTADARHGLGYVDDSSASTVTVLFTLYGDADLDGGVSILDFNQLVQHFGQATARGWSEGDFDYDGGVSIEDFNLLAGNFGQNLHGVAAVPDYVGLLAFAAAHNDLARFEAVTGVPEPAALGLLLGGGVALRRRRTPRV